MGIRLEQRQKQLISQQLIQSVNILQMNAAELADYVKEMSLENPVIDFVEASPLECELTPADQERLRRLEWPGQQHLLFYQEIDAHAIIIVGGGKNGYQKTARKREGCNGSKTLMGKFAA